MRLRTFESFWLISDGILSSYPSLRNKNENAEVVVIGGGITGALVSYCLVKNNYDVILLDKRDIGMGSTAASTSMLQYEIDVPLIDLCKQIGENGAVECYQAGIAAIDTLEALIRTENTDCGFERKQSLYIAKTESDSRWLKQEYALRNKHKLGVQWLEKDAVVKEFGIQSHGAILSQTAGGVDVYKLTHKLIELSVRQGLRVYDQTEIADIDFKLNRPVIKTKTDCTVTCGQIVFCTGYEATTLLKENICKIFSTYACVSEQGITIPAGLKNLLVWDTGDPYFYMRTTDDGRLLIGGADSAFKFIGFTNRIRNSKLKQLKDELAKVCPGLEFTDDFSWSGKFGSTKDGLPYIGRSKEYDHALFALGYGGNGIVFSVQAMQIVIDLLEGKGNSLAHWYRFGR